MSTLLGVGLFHVDQCPSGRTTRGGDAEAIAKEKGFEALDTSALEAAVDAAIAAQPDAWAKFVAGEGKAMGALVGAVMKASGGKADGKAVTALLNARKG